MTEKNKIDLKIDLPTKNWNTYYDESKFIVEEIAWFQQNKQEFLLKLWDEDRKVESVTDKEIEDYFYNDHYISEEHFYRFIYDLNDEFMDYVDEKVSVKGTNMGWRNRTGYKEFTLKKGEDIFRQIAPKCDLTFHIEKVKEKEYKAIISHHDSPMGETYNIKIKQI